MANGEIFTSHGYDILICVFLVAKILKMFSCLLFHPHFLWLKKSLLKFFAIFLGEDENDTCFLII